MKELEFAFEPAPWELMLRGLKPGGRISAARFLSVLEGEDEDTFQQALDSLGEKGVTLDLGDLPRVACTGPASERLALEEKLAHVADIPRELEQGDPLAVYLEELAGIPAYGDEDLLAQAVAQGDAQARERLIHLSLHRVVELARDHTGRGVLLLDLIQEGSMGLWQGIMAYTGGPFGPWRDGCIQRALARAVVAQARANGTGQRIRQAVEAFCGTEKALQRELGRSPTLEETAERMHTTVEDAAELEKLVLDAKTAAQNKKEPQTPETDPDEDKAVEDTAYFQARSRILELLSVLEETDARILTLRYGLEGGLPLSVQETGSKLGMTATEVVTREAEALAKLRNQG